MNFYYFFILVNFYKFSSKVRDGIQKVPL